ncbi:MULTISPECIES: hypothetical protein [unclassified Colwellia]|uniref:hypothetical protein n=1 Tax=unclassified Colwellia TaxID=196834 RepID=UPI0015F39A62|nr:MULTISPECIES: hypothetical protein [unclassified Colwellia]MBA6232637.1 hypothetical protein [Colwellia sp. MB02u-7]MBA6235222.1 hypothetical protein [Colwellia sp. MB02u-11]MBA6257956.1 hypothetical protein [Colwellia sp. MB3u-28]MBA6258364.1 hypothetical protein [Colwellia sp. MB3u-41]MBA6299272.1 hypothetical protein [Colwellia sp. MB3u-22]
MSKSFLAAFTAQVKLLDKPSWGHLVFLNDWEISVPEIFPVVTDLTTFCIHNGLEKSAQVYSKSILKKMYLDKMVIKIHGNFERRVFLMLIWQ